MKITCLLYIITIDLQTEFPLPTLFTCKMNHVKLKVHYVEFTVQEFKNTFLIHIQFRSKVHFFRLSSRANKKSHALSFFDLGEPSALWGKSHNRSFNIQNYFK